jgi:methyltransferase (TIGR00027 family)
VRAGADLVVNLAAGLDTRAWRLSLPATLRWVDVDLPEILDYKTAAMRDVTPHCRYEAVAADLTDAARRQALFAQLGRESTKALVVTEGLLIYLTPESVAGLARDLHDIPAFRWWLIDIANPRLLQMMNKMWGASVEAARAPFQFAPAAGTDFFREHGWREVQFRSTMDEAHRLDREMKGMWKYRWMTKLMPAAKREEMRRFSGTVLLEREA